MASSTPSAPQGADQPGVSAAAPAQMQASTPSQAPAPASYGTAATGTVVFRDYASI